MQFSRLTAKEGLDIFTALKRPEKLLNKRTLKKMLALSRKQPRPAQGEDGEEGEALVGEEEAEQEDLPLIHWQEEPPPPPLQEPGRAGRHSSNSDLSVTSVICHLTVKGSVMTI